MPKQMVKNPLPTIQGTQSILNSISINLMAKVFFNPTLEPYALEGAHSVIMDNFFGTIIAILIIVPPAIKTIEGAKQAGKLSQDIPEKPFWQKLPRKKWTFILLLMAICAPVIAGLMVFVFKFYDFQELQFYRYFWLRALFSYWVGKFLIKVTILRFTQPR